VTSKTANTNTTLAAFNQEIRAKIPVVAALGIEFTQFAPNQVKLKVQFEPNRNHVNTVFGGSLYSACALACYGLFRAMAESSGFTEDFLVIQEGDIKYRKPVTGDFEVIADPQAHLDLTKFLESVQRQKKGRLPLEARVLQNGQECALFTGIYVMRIPN